MLLKMLSVAEVLCSMGDRRMNECGHGWGDSDRTTNILWEKVCPRATLWTTNLTWTGLVLNLGLCSGRPVT